MSKNIRAVKVETQHIQTDGKKAYKVDLSKGVTDKGFSKPQYIKIDASVKLQDGLYLGESTFFNTYYYEDIKAVKTHMKDNHIKNALLIPIYDIKKKDF